MYKSTLEQWKTLKTVIECGGVNAAAEQLHKTQSTISYTINKLQTQLGVTIFQQHGRRISLTSTGTRLLNEVIPSLKNIERIEKIASTLATGLESHIKIIADSLFPRNLLFSSLARLRDQYPTTQVEVLDLVRIHPDTFSDFDIMICVGEGGIAPGIKLLEINLLPIAHPEHSLLQQADEVELQEIYDEFTVHYQNSHLMQKSPHNALNYWTLNTLEGVLSAIQNNICIGWLPEDYVKPYLENGMVKVIPIKNYHNVPVPLYLCTKSDGPAVDFFCQQIQTACREWE